MSDVEQTRRRLRKELGREPEIQEIAHELYPSPQSNLTFKESDSTRLLEEKMKEVLEGLTPFEKAIVGYRFGFFDGRPRTLEEVGQEFNLERDQIRQIEAKALKKLRHPTRSRWPQR